MNKNKRLKPNLLDPMVEKKIIKTLKPIKEDYWAPTKNTFQSFFQNYIKPNLLLVFIIFLIIFFLVYRYRNIKKEKEKQELEKIYNPISNTNIVTITDSKQTTPNDTQKKTDNISEKNINEYTNLLLQYYNLQKENLREPTSSKNRNRPKILMNQPKLAYQIYPYGNGGMLAPSGSR